MKCTSPGVRSRLHRERKVVSVLGIEPRTSCLKGRCSTD